ncbi:MAG: hypothetical protein AAGF11_33750 [Myxococcota bacterium]
MRQFIDIIIRANNGHYDFERDRGPQRAVQQNKTGGKQIKYVEIEACPWRIYGGTFDAQLFAALDDWNASPTKHKLKIRFNAHGSPNYPNMIMGGGGPGNPDQIDPYSCARWLWNHGLSHTGSDAWTLTFSMACCHASTKMCGEFANGLHCFGIHGFKVTGSPHTVALGNGHVNANRGPRMLLGCIPLKGNRYVHWDEANGSKQAIIG